LVVIPGIPLTEIGKVGEIADGTMKRVNVQGRSILLARVQDRYYAVANTCTHMGGDLSQGSLAGTVVTCPRHHSRFDVRDGRVVRWVSGGFYAAMVRMFKPEKGLQSYPVTVDSGRIMIEAGPGSGA